MRVFVFAAGAGFAAPMVAYSTALLSRERAHAAAKAELPLVGFDCRAHWRIRQIDAIVRSIAVSCLDLQSLSLVWS